MHRVSALALLALSVAACGGAPPPEPETPVAKAEPKPEPKSAPAPEPTAEKKGPPPAAPPKVTGAPPPAAEEETQTVSGSQCKSLEAIVGGLVYKEQISKIDAKLADDVKRRAESAAVDAAKQVSESFHDTCMSNFVGKPIRRDILDCMLKAKQFSAFEACRKM